ncbi:SMI1/KNR4 family protein [Streptomyces cinereoruber]|uniref:SMI1/KNR4 family protein n=1 Tax=Streptomyces cinereoruber TaxID=67260 RepID=A0ABX6BGJ0_9ACTN|nr:SMI1/KNR4 family protein [Streptomyces cinereoruber]QEV34015.1 SMI1/KNR4 family protein [Streptomyces cinereoruber]
MTDIEELVRRVAAKAKATSTTLPPAATAEEVAEAEAILGFTLPPLLASLYREVANGGYGPDYQLLPLIGEGHTILSEYRSERSASAEEETPYWPADVLPILDWGCGMYAAVDCRSETATVLLFDPNPMTDDGAEAWFLDAESLTEWLETWLAGTGWYREDADEHEDVAEPTPWETAAARIAE